MNTIAIRPQTAPGSPGDAYRFDHPRLSDILNDMFIWPAEPEPGDMTASVDLQTTDGGRLRSADLASDGRPTLLVFGSRTCPVTESAATGLKELYAAHGARVRFVLVQVREAHPGLSIPQPQTSEQKLRHAVDLKRHHRLPFEVAVDDIEGTLHRSLGTKPSSAHIIAANGERVFRAQWANQTEALNQALSAVAAGQQPPVGTVTRTARAITRTVGYMSSALGAAGKGARADTWRIAPPMAVMMTVADLFWFLPRHERGAPAIIALGVVALVTLGAGILALGTL